MLMKYPKTIHVIRLKTRIVTWILIVVVDVNLQWFARNTCIGILKSSKRIWLLAWKEILDGILLCHVYDLSRTRNTKVKSVSIFPREGNDQQLRKDAEYNSSHKSFSSGEKYQALYWNLKSFSRSQNNIILYSFFFFLIILQQLRFK